MVPHQHRLAGRGEVALDELMDEFIIGTRFTPGLDQVITHLSERGRTPVFTGHALPDYQSVRALAAAGDGVGVVPRLATTGEFAGTVTIPLAGRTPYRSVLVAQATGAATSAASAAMMALLEEITGDLGLDRPDDRVGDLA